MVCIYWRSKHPSPQKRLGTGGYPSYTSVACFLLRRYSRCMCTPMQVCAHTPPSLFWRGVLRMAVDRSWAQSNYDSKAHSWNQNRINGPNQGHINLPSWPEREPCLEESLVWDICWLTDSFDLTPAVDPCFPRTYTKMQNTWRIQYYIGKMLIRKLTAA